MDCNCFRPGGLQLTERALSRIKLPLGSKVLDIGCGGGATVMFLRENYAYDAYGVDIDEDSIRTANLNCGGELFFCAPAESLPFSDKTFDAVFLECSLSCTQKPSDALCEAYRILKKGGYLVLSDVYAQNAPLSASGFLGRLEAKDAILRNITGCGFEVISFEDHIDYLRKMMAEMILCQGGDAFYEAAGADREALKAARCSYCLAVATKSV